MAKKKAGGKTNAARILDGLEIPYELKEYPVDESDLSAVHVAAAVGMPLEMVFKTLVARGDKTGVLMACPPDFPAEPHTRAVLDLSGGMQLRFADVRRFGRLWLIDAGEVDDFTGMDRLGAEPFDPCITGAWLKERLGRSSRAVKTCLLDQTAVCGIGNIYSDEILFAARIHPQRPARSLTAPEWKRLAQTTKELMSFHVEQTRASPEEYLRTRGREYRNTPFLRVYGHAGEACPVCGTKLERAVIGGRSSVFCPKCQMRRAERDRP